MEPAARHLDTTFTGVDHADMPHLIYRVSDMTTHTHHYRCGHDTHQHDHDHLHHHHHHANVDHADHEGGILFDSYSRLHTTAHNDDTHYVKLLVVNDIGRYNHLKATKQHLQTEQLSLGLINSAQAFYMDSSSMQPLTSTRLPVVGMVTIVDEKSQNALYTISPTTPTDFSKYLSAFSSWVTVNYPLDGSKHRTVFNPRDTATLISGYEFASSVRGLAFRGRVCLGNSASINQAKDYDAFDASTIAHEIGHNLGMCHDDIDRTGTTCPPLGTLTVDECRGYIMQASSSPSNAPEVFSTCSNSDMTSFYSSLRSNTSVATCLEKPTATYGVSSVCGNGFVDPGEECDCGKNDGTSCAEAPIADFNDACCNSSTCTFIGTCKEHRMLVCLVGFVGGCW